MSFLLLAVKVQIRWRGWTGCSPATLQRRCSREKCIHQGERVSFKHGNVKNE